MAAHANFALTREFVDAYASMKVPFGYGGLGEFVYYRTYARQLHEEEGAPLEQWYQTVERVVNGTMNMLRRHLAERWCAEDYTLIAQVMYDRMFHMKCLPAGRGLWAMGSPLTEERGLYAALSNCAFVSTLYIGDRNSDIAIDPFTFLMDASMCGIGVGFDTKGEGKRFITSHSSKETIDVVIPDSREGWVESLAYLLRHYFFNEPAPIFDYSLVRPAGAPIRTFGGVSGGPEPLRAMHERLTALFEKRRAQYLTLVDIVDIMNIIGKCVVSGNVRRSAEIAIGPNDQAFIDLKNADVYPERQAHAWVSNNSVLTHVDDDYSAIAESIKLKGEPGIFWLDNVQAYSRVRKSGKDFKDLRAIGTNPCAEQPLEHHELCCLVETFPAKHDSLQDFIDTLTVAMFYVKVITLGKTQWKETNAVIERNRRVGVSMSGIVQFIDKFSRDELKRWCKEGYTFLKDYDARLSDSWQIAHSIKITTVKPSGTVSLLAGATPGVHYPIFSHYIRRVRVSKDSTLLPPLLKAGYSVVPADISENAMVVEFPVCVGGTDIPSEQSVSMLDQLALVAFMQRCWSDNGVSATIKFNPATEGDHICAALQEYQHKLKAISFLPNVTGVYNLAPYEAIHENVYKLLHASVRDVDWRNATNNEPKEHTFCDADGCTPIRRQKSPKQ